MAVVPPIWMPIDFLKQNLILFFDIARPNMAQKMNLCKLRFDRFWKRLATRETFVVSKELVAVLCKYLSNAFLILNLFTTVGKL